jgi:hypothetical protein
MPIKSTTPTYLELARTFYADAFDHKKKRDLANSMADWAEMEEDEQSFTVAHLLYLNLQAQAANQRMLGQVRDLLDEVADALTQAIEASLSEGPRPLEEPEGDDDTAEMPPRDQVPSGDPVTPTPAAEPTMDLPPDSDNGVS